MTEIDFDLQPIRRDPFVSEPEGSEHHGFTHDGDRERLNASIKERDGEQHGDSKTIDGETDINEVALLRIPTGSEDQYYVAEKLGVDDLFIDLMSQLINDNSSVFRYSTKALLL